MNNAENEDDLAPTGAERPVKGPNLVLLYCLLALALVAAIGFAIAIVWPFYIRR